MFYSILCSTLDCWGIGIDPSTHYGYIESYTNVNITCNVIKNPAGLGIGMIAILPSFLPSSECLLLIISVSISTLTLTLIRCF